MKILIVAICLLSATICHAGKSVSIGEFKYQGKIIKNATAELESANSVRIFGSGGTANVAWNELNAAAQFKLKPARQEMLEKESANKAEDEAAQRRIQLGEHRLKGYIVEVRADGCLVSCEIPAPTRVYIPVSSMTRIGGGGGRPPQGHTAPEPPYADGSAFVKGLKGYADGESISIKAFKTDQMFQEQALTARIYTLQAPENAK